MSVFGREAAENPCPALRGGTFVLGPLFAILADPDVWTYADGGTAGFVQATVERNFAEATIAYVIAKPLWGRGIGGEAVGVMLGFLCGEPRVRRSSDRRSSQRRFVAFARAPRIWNRRRA